MVSSIMEYEDHPLLRRKENSSDRVVYFLAMCPSVVTPPNE